MKTLIFATIFSFFLIHLMAQNYIGFSQTKILKLLGEPEEKGQNYISYPDENEEGINKYYFDNNNVCIEYSMTRTKKYLTSYQKLLSKEFHVSSNNNNTFQSKTDDYLAILTQSDNDFTIRVLKPLTLTSIYDIK